MIQEILGEGGTGTFLDESDLYAQPWLGYDDKNEPGSLQSQGTYQTNLKKGAGLTMDPAFILGLGTSAGGYSQDAFNPTPYFRPVQANGQRLAQRWASSGDPLQGLIAARALQGAGPGIIEAEILTALEDPDPKNDALRKAIPPSYFKDPTSINGQMVKSDQPDYQFLRDQITLLTGEMAKDSGLWDGETIDPETGEPAAVGYEDSVAQQALTRGGFTANPYETYDPYSFAPEGVTFDTDREKLAGSRTANKAQRAARVDVRTKEQMLRELLKGQTLPQYGPEVPIGATTPAAAPATATLQQGIQQRAAQPAAPFVADPNYSGPSFEATPKGYVSKRQAEDDLSEYTINPSTGAVISNRPESRLAPSSRATSGGDGSRFFGSSRARAGGGGGGGAPGVREVEAFEKKRKEAERAVQVARRNNMKAHKERGVAADARTQAIWAAKNRQRMVEELLAAGHGPFMDQMRARQANAWPGA
jgi:hypothetical protein